MQIKSFSDLKPTFILMGTACIFVSVAWLAQALSFSGENAAEASVLWTLSGAAIAGLGAGFLLAGRWLQGENTERSLARI